MERAKAELEKSAAIPLNAAMAGSLNPWFFVSRAKVMMVGMAQDESSPLKQFL
jgi:hypothetical protein